MTFNDKIAKAANVERLSIQTNPDTPTVDHGESVAILVWWSFLMDHSRSQGIPVEQLARAQLEAFIPYALDAFHMLRPDQH